MRKKDLEYNQQAMLDCLVMTLAEYQKHYKKCAKHDVIVGINMREPSYRKRFFIWDITGKDAKLLRAHHTTHGVNSNSRVSRAYAKYFSNTPESRKSSLGAMITAGTYYGKHGLSMKLKGLEPGINDNVFKRYIVVHKASYVTDSYIMRNGRAGNSWGCPALDPAVYKEVIDLIKGGAFFYIYY